jgi:hypothetical protein
LKPAKTQHVRTGAHNFEDVLAPLHRDESLQRLQVHLPGYAKGQSGHWAATQDRLDAATARASALAAAGHNAHDGQAPFTDMHSLIDRLASAILDFWTYDVAAIAERLQGLSHRGGRRSLHSREQAAIRAALAG